MRHRPPRTAALGQGKSNIGKGGVIAVVTMVVALLPQTPTFAAAVKPKTLEAQQMESMHGSKVQPEALPADLSQGAGSSGKGWAWPAAGVATVTLAAPDLAAASVHQLFSGDLPTRTKAGNLPVWIDHPHGDPSALSGRALQVSVLDRNSLPGAWRNGVVLRLNGAKAGPSGNVNVSVDYSAFAGAFGGDWASRLKMVRLPECALTTPDLPACAATDVAASVNSSATRSVSADVSIPAVTAPVAEPSSSSTDLTVTQPSAILLALTAGASGSAGDFGATSLQASSTWSAGGNSGDYSWTYPLRTPPALGGPAPQMALAYSSTSVDGRSEVTNNQPSQIGEGFEYWPGYIERTYKPCADDKTNGNNSTDTGDECWGTDNATMSLNGSGGELIKDGATGTWRLKNDDNSKIEHLTNTTNADNDHEYWKITTGDGNQFYFGLNRLPGYTGTAPANKTTNSVWTVPVAGNQAGEPCHQSSFTSSFCSQAWRWNLDYVVDRHGNTMSIFYNTESNNYGRNNSDTDVVSYTRGGSIDHIDYGTDDRSGTDTENTSTSAPMRVMFTPGDRCLSSCTTHDATHWPDTPWDQSCTSSTSCPNLHSPTFWTTKRIASITTKVWDAGTSAYRDVDVWTLTQNFPDPGDGTRAGMWLDSVTHAGKVGGTTVTLPSVNFDWIQMPNRVDTSTDGAYPMNWMRIGNIWTESGEKITVRYTSQDCIPGTRMPSSPQSNTLRCYPVLEEQPDKSIKTEYFNKYLVSSVTEADLTGGSPDVVTSYEYVGSPAWRHTDDDGITKDNLRTWSDFRGYSQVNTLLGELGSGTETLSESTFFRGMNGDLDGSGGTRSVTLPAIDLNHDGVTDPASQAGDAPAVNDDDAYSGIVRQTTLYNGVESAPVSTQVFQPWESAPTATRDMGQTTVYARHIQTASTWSATALSSGQYEVARSDSTLDSYGMETQTNDYGDTAVTGDERCIKTTYDRNTTTNLLSLAERVETYALPCGQSPTSDADVISDARTSFDNQAYGATPTLGDTTKEERVKSWTPTSETWLTTATYTQDAYGRVIDTTDVRGNHTQTAFTPASGGPVTKTVETNPMGWTTTTELEPAWGSVVGSVDMNNKRTDAAYDALGRLTQVWLPTHSKASFPTQPNTIYSYLIRNTGGPNAVTTQKLNANLNYVTSYELFDGLLRTRQTQQISDANGNVGTDFTEQKYDAQGRATIASTYFDATVQPSTTLYTIPDWVPKTQNVTVYDRANRTTAVIFNSAGAEKWRTTTTYDGLRTSVVPPLGGIATTTIVDGTGRTSEVRQYHDPADVGSDTRSTYDVEKYTYDRKGQHTQTTDNAGNLWTYTFDLLGRQVASTDPDKGSSSAAYNDSGDVTGLTDSRGQTLAFTYDSIGRKTGEYDTSTAGAKLATWAYDPIGAKGQLASASRWVGTDEYKVKVRGYTATYLSTGEDYTIPASQTGLAGTYSISRSYKVDGSVAALSYPNVGGLGAETLTYTYDDVTGLPEQLQTNAPGLGTYVTNTDYTAFGEPSFVQFQTTAGNWLQRGFNYDDSTRRLVETQAIRQISPQPVNDVKYAFDPNGDITSISDAPAGQTADNQCFKYDWAQRVTDAWTPSSGDCNAAPATAGLGGPAPYWQSWSFDAVGDRLSQTVHATAGDTTSTYTYNAAGSAQPHAVQSVVTTGPGVNKTDNYTYDPIGDTTTRPGVASGQTLTWDAEGRLSKDTEAGKDSTYIYSPDGDRILQHDPTTTTVYLPGTEIHRNNSTGAISATRYYTWGGFDVATISTGGSLTWLVTDTQGTQLVSVASGNQTITKRRQTPFGTVRGTSPTWPDSRGFVNGDNDVTGLVHIGSRYYDPNLGRFISVDPVFEASDPQSWSAYVYADNDPVTQSDPSGNFSCSWCKSIAKKTFAKVWVNTIDVGFHALGTVTPLVNSAAHDSVSGLRWASNHIGGPFTWAYNKEQSVSTAIMGTPSDPSPIRLGWEWATGSGPKERTLDGNSSFVKTLQQHSNVQSAREWIADHIGKVYNSKKDGPIMIDVGVTRPWDYSLKDVGHKGLENDILHNESAFYLGSYHMNFKITGWDKKAGTATVQFTIDNQSDINSGTHLGPGIGGYGGWWKNNIADPLLSRFQGEGPFTPTHQHITWTETINLKDPKPPTSGHSGGSSGGGSGGGGSGGGSGGGGGGGGGSHGIGGHMIYAI